MKPQSGSKTDFSGGGAPLSRPPLERMLRIHQALLKGNFPNGKSLSRELEVSPKSIQRDMEFMRDRLSLPIEYNPQRFGFFYTGPVDAFPTMQISEGELLALVVAEKAMEQYRGTSFEQPLLSAIRKMEKSLPDSVSLSLPDIDRAISFMTRAEPILDLGVFDTLAKATTQKHQLEIAYRKPGQKEAEKRVIDPLHLANVNGEWFLFAFDHLRGEIRTFAPARIKAISETGKTFEPPKNFSVQQRLKDSFGVHAGKERHTVVIRFNEQVADYIREKKWHDSQKLNELKDGSVELILELSSLAEVERWVMSWGGNAQAVSPAELVQSIEQSARRILGQTPLTK